MSRRAHFVVVLTALLLVATQAFALHATTKRPHKRTTRHFRRVAWNPLFRGSHELLVRENMQIDELQLPRIMNDEELEQLEAAEELVPVADSTSLSVASNLLPTRRYCRPWTRDFLEEFAAAYYAEFHKPITVTSLVRTAQQQKKLRRRNRNAAPQEGETASTHLTGMTIDILKRGMTKKQKKWVEAYFLPLKDRGAIQPIEERRQPVFHITVFNTYNDKYPLNSPPRIEPAVDTEIQSVPAILLDTDTGSMPQLGAQD